ncbi:MAG: hypothetical protein BWY32_03616 [bacterium ADurb.Bin243]|nr:MAG: hypothetical protein BWY32_03616 [bacterium ADurb.Bin243]
MTNYSGIQKLLVFLLLFFSAGASLGIVTLLGPVAYATKILREYKTDPDIEKIIVNSMILILILTSGIVSAIISNFYLRWGYNKKLIVLLTLSAVFFSAPMILFLNPSSLRPFMPAETTLANFVFGPYPDMDILKKIRRDNYSAVISLLHPAVLPFEPELLKREEENCAKLGIKLIKAPMLPWISENKESLEIISQLAENKTGKYYIHCYLGRDRVFMAKRIIEKQNKAAEITAVSTKRNIDSVKAFERGEIYKFTGEIYLTPYPTDEEFTSFVLNGNFKTILSLLNINDKEDAALIGREKETVKLSPVEFHNISIPADCDEKSLYTAAAEKIHESAKPVLVHGFRIDSMREKLMIEELNKRIK